MQYRQYENRNVRIELKTGRIIKGYVGDYIFAEDNFNGQESLVIDRKGLPPTEIYTDEIKSIGLI